MGRGPAHPSFNAVWERIEPTCFCSSAAARHERTMVLVGSRLTWCCFFCCSAEDIFYWLHSPHGGGTPRCGRPLLLNYCECNKLTRTAWLHPSSQLLLLLAAYVCVCWASSGAARQESSFALFAMCVVHIILVCTSHPEQRVKIPYAMRDDRAADCKMLQEIQRRNTEKYQYEQKKIFN